MKLRMEMLRMYLLALFTALSGAASAQTVSLYHWYNAAQQDHALSVVWAPGSSAAAVAGYTLVREEGRAFSRSAPQPPDTVPLHIWFSPSRMDYFSSTEPVWRGGPGQTRSPDYQWVMLQGYIYDRPLAGTLPLYHWFNFDMGDNLETTDPRWESAGANPRAGYELGTVQGYLLPPAGPQAPETADRFHFGALAPFTSEQLVGERPAVLFLLNYSDKPLRHSPSFFDQWLFGPGFPNARDYMLENSQFLFTWKRGEVIQVNVPDDPDTTGNESLWRDNWDPDHPDFLYLSLAAPNANLISAINSGGGGLSWATAFGEWEQLALADFNGGHLMSGDTVAFKTVGGFFLRENDGVLSADATSAALTSAHFVVSEAANGQIQPGDIITLQCVSNGRYVQAVGGGGGAIITTATAPGAKGLFTLAKGWPVQGSLLRRAAREAARLGSFHPATYDRDHDGHLTSLEMTTVVLESSPPQPDDGGAQTAGTGAFTVPGSTVSIELMVSASGEDVSFATLTHEMTHQLGGVDLYGPCSLNGDFTLMDATAGGAVNNTKIYNLDPWHRLMWGWTEPLIRMVRQPAMSDRLTTLDVLSLEDKRPVLLYDPARYDLETRTGEYLLLEYRTRSFATNRYDRNIYTEGLAAWYVKTRADGGLDSAPVPCGTADQAVLILGQPESRPGDGQLWTGDNGRFSLRWPDGSPVPLTMQVAAGPYHRPTLDVEWSPPGGFLPRLDSVAVSSTSPCYLLALNGIFPIDPGAVSLSRAGVPFPCFVRSWDIRQIVLQLAHGTPAGVYTLQVLNGATGGNRVQFHLTETVHTPPGVFQFISESYSVGESAPAAIITVRRSDGSCGAVSVTYSVAAATADAGLDFTAPIGAPTLDFAEGEITKTFTVPILPDELNEDSEAVRLTLVSATGAGTIGSLNQATLSIIDDDPTPSISVGDIAITEGANASVFVEVPFTLSAPSGRTVRAGYATQNDTAIASIDYHAEESVVTFPPGTTRITSRVEILPDLLDEEDEQFLVRLGSPLNATLGTDTARVTILDNAPSPTLAINDLIVTEGNDDIQQAEFTIRLSAPSGRTVRFRATTANGTAIAGEDYGGILVPVAALAPGETTFTISVPIVGTPGREPDKTFYLRLSDPLNAMLADAEGTCTIKELRLLSIQRDGPDMILTFPTGNTGRRYHVQRTDSLSRLAGSWTELTPPAGLEGTGDVVTFRDAGGVASGRNQFYRVRQD